MDHSVIGVFCYNGGSLSIRIGLDSSIGGVAQELHEKWPELGLKCYNMCFNHDEKDNLIESDGELHSLAYYCFAKKIAIVEIRVVVCVTSLITSSGSISASSSSSSSSSVSDGVVIVRKPFKSNFWARNFDGSVGQRFALGAPEFRCKLIEYSNVNGYKYELIKNDEFKVTTNPRYENDIYCEEHKQEISNVVQSIVNDTVGEQGGGDEEEDKPKEGVVGSEDDRKTDTDDDDGNAEKDEEKKRRRTRRKRKRTTRGRRCKRRRRFRGFEYVRTA
ncbi:hypothetical protein IFM89_025999 [Coptis chinensis]|uniref:Uncharacterized protein n=1 Tax=Coptis chinensis TaxID=261450 RepID=A0A835M0T3_9MAGN|nr:hypothetical protein IFM89_025999 [Coptis chinensis]